MKWEPRPLPEVTPETERYWSAAAAGQLLFRECIACGLQFCYPRALCPDCFSDDVQWVEARGTGKVYTYSVARTVDNWPHDDLPLIVAYVELDEGPRMLTNIDARPSEVAVGTDVQARFVESEEEPIAIPVFAPTGQGGPSS